MVGGVSTGALNAIGVAMYAKGDEVNMAQNLVNFWQTLESENVYKSWDLGIFQGLFEKGFYNNENFKKTINDFFTKEL